MIELNSRSIFLHAYYFKAGILHAASRFCIPKRLFDSFKITGNKIFADMAKIRNQMLKFAGARPMEISNWSNI